MADYWKSQAKKFCEFCKCWIADNRPSIEFHEKGKRHRENVTLRIKNITRQSQKEYKEKKKIDEEMKIIEQAALEAYMNDVKANADYTSKLLNERINEGPNEQSKSSTSVAKEKKVEEAPEESSSKVWYEAVSDTGYTYYWNIETGESVWDIPEEGYLSLAEQKQIKEKELQKEAKKKAEEIRIKEAKEKEKRDEYRALMEREKSRSRVKVEEVKTEEVYFGPPPKANPYGAWKTVKISEQSPGNTDSHKQKCAEIRLLSSDDSKTEFKEKTIGSLEGYGTSFSFKKRKMNFVSKRNIRQRLDND